MNTLQSIVGLILAIVCLGLIYRNRQKSKSLEILKTIFAIGQYINLINPKVHLDLHSLNLEISSMDDITPNTLLKKYLLLKKNEWNALTKSTVCYWLSQIFYKSSREMIVYCATMQSLKQLGTIFDSSIDMSNDDADNIRFLVLEEFFEDPEFDFGFVTTLNFTKSSSMQIYEVISFINENRKALDAFQIFSQKGIERKREILSRYRLILSETSEGNALQVIDEWIARNGMPPVSTE